MNEAWAAVNWEKRRRVLVHDSLKNHLNPALAKLCAVLEKKVEDPTFVENLSRQLANRQYSIEDEIEWLVQNAEGALSPRMLFAIEPLNNLDPDILDWFPDAMHELWAASANLGATISAVEVAAGEFVAERDQLSGRLVYDSDSQSLSSARNLQRLCVELAELLMEMRALVPLPLART